MLGFEFEVREYITAAHRILLIEQNNYLPEKQTHTSSRLPFFFVFLVSSLQCMCHACVCIKYVYQHWVWMVMWQAYKHKIDCNTDFIVDNPKVKPRKKRNIECDSFVSVVSLSLARALRILKCNYQEYGVESSLSAALAAAYLFAFRRSLLAFRMVENGEF